MYKYLLFFLIGFCGFAQNDSIKLKNNDLIVGEVKSLKTGVLIVKTSYSDKDFQIEFEKVTSLNLHHPYTINLSGGKRIYGTIKSTEPSMLIITDEKGNTIEAKIEDLVVLQEIDEMFWSRFSASVDLGYNFTKTNNAQQFTAGVKLGYLSNLWNFKFKIDALRSAQDDTENIERLEGSIESQRLLYNQWFLLANVSYLSNTEQGLKGRTSPKVGAGKYLVSTSKMNLGVSAGYNYNIENYYDTTLNKESSELFLSSNLNMFGVKDFDFTTGFSVYPSLSESKRIRLDYNLDLKYDLPLDFYIKAGLTVNYDNQPAIAGNETDYYFISGFGWEL